MRLTGPASQAVSAIGICSLAGFGFGKLVKLEESPTVQTFTGIERPSRSTSAARTPFEEFQSLLSPVSRETDIWKVVSRISPDRIRDAIREIAALDQQGTYLPRKREILSALYFHWAETQPQAALADISSQSKSLERTDLVKSVLAAWMRSDANEAYRAVKNHEDFEYYGLTMLVRTWTPETVFENLGHHSENHRDVLGHYCASLDNKPEARDEMIKALQENPKMKSGDWAKFRLFRSWGYKDFDAAIAKAEEMKSPDLVNLLVKDNAGQPFGGPKVFKWAARNHVAPEGPDWEKGYAEWLGYDGANARAWLVEQAPVWETEGHAAAAASFLARDYSNALEMKFTSEKESAEKRLEDLLVRWRTNNPQAAAKWLESAPEAARGLLGGKGGNR